MNITIIGTGYVGLVTGARLADLGNNVFCLDVDQAKVDPLNSGGVPIYEPGLREVIERNVEAGRLTFSTDVAAPAVEDFTRPDRIVLGVDDTPAGQQALIRAWHLFSHRFAKMYPLNYSYGR
jgi:UDP-glucose 6-dehydrogenase